jgi:hypothetical protein
MNCSIETRGDAEMADETSESTMDNRTTEGKQDGNKQQDAWPEKLSPGMVSFSYYSG